MKSKIKYRHYAGLFFSSFIPALIIYLLMIKFGWDYEAKIPWAVIMVVAIPIGVAVTFYMYLKSCILHVRYLELNKVNMFHKVVRIAASFFNFSVCVLVVISLVIIMTLAVVDTMHVHIICTCIAAFGGAELYLVAVLMKINKELSEFFLFSKVL